MCAGDRYRVHSRLKFDHQGSAIFSDRLAIENIVSGTLSKTCGEMPAHIKKNVPW